jgi:2-methylcitrate dehydratase
LQKQELPIEGTKCLLPASSNQARGLGEYCRDFLFNPKNISLETLGLLERFHLDSVGCAISAIHHRANACTVLRDEALRTKPAGTSKGGICFGASNPVETAKSVAANVSAVREWDSNGTNFGYDKNSGRMAGEFGHNDFYPVAIAAGREAGFDGNHTLRLMLLIDEIRGRLAEVFPLRKYAIDHVHHGTIACAAGYTAALGGTAAEVESAIGLVVSQYVPFRALRAGHQLSDSKGASAAFAAETAVMAAQRALLGFRGPQDIFRNPLAIYRLNEPSSDGVSPFDLELGESGNAFAIHAMHFKLGLYEHQSAAAIQSLIDIIERTPAVGDDIDDIQSITVTIYEPAFSIIADPAKRTPNTRQSADHSLPFILATVLQKASRMALQDRKAFGWSQGMLLPEDYSEAALTDVAVRAIMKKIHVIHGGPEYDRLYPEGLPTCVSVVHKRLKTLDSERILFPLGHANSDQEKTSAFVEQKFERLVAGAVESPQSIREHLSLKNTSPEHVANLYAFPLVLAGNDE